METKKEFVKDDTFSEIKDIEDAVISGSNRKEVISKKKTKKEFMKAGTLISVGAGVGKVIGGSIGIAAFGGAVGIPLSIAGGALGLLSYGAYKACKEHFKEIPENQEG